MNLKKLTRFKYVMRTLLLAAFGGAMVGVLAETVVDGLAGTVALTAIMGGVLGAAISSMNYRKFIIPMKKMIDSLELIIDKSDVKAGKLETIDDITKGFFLLIGGMAGTIGEKATRLTSAVEQLSASSQETSAGANHTARVMSELADTVKQTSLSAGPEVG